MERMTDAEIKELAIALSAGAVFTDRHLVDNVEMIPMVFMPLGLGGPELGMLMQEVIFPEGRDGPMGMVYEYMDQAGPRSVNGYPIFHSVKFIGPDDLAKVNAVLDVIASV